ncbi:MAG TPA: GAF domain-containing SpoIIE family protein phosphatase, partial [Candidatus Xenobia bacterium]
EVLQRMLHLDFVQVAIAHPRFRWDATWERGRRVAPGTADLNRPGLLTIPLGIDAATGALQVSCARPDFPDSGDHLLLHLAANHIVTFVARRAAEMARERTQRELVVLAKAGRLLSESLDYQATLRAVAHLLVPGLADWCKIHIVEGREIRNAASLHASPEKAPLLDELMSEYPPAWDSPSPSSQAIETRRSVLLQELDTDGRRKLALDARHHRLYEELGTSSLIAVPLMARGQVLGSITLVSSTRGRYTADDVVFLEDLAGRAALSLDNARLYRRERDIMQTFVESFLGRAPAHRELDVASVYQPAYETQRVGGDFFDFIDIDSNHLGIVMGDVCGKGIQAATHTAAAKYMLRGFVVEDPAPALALRRVNRAIFANVGKEALFLSLVFVVLDLTTGHLCYANAGHPAPLIRSATGWQCLESTGPLIGLLAETEYQERSLFLPEDATLFLYTDGVSEAGRTIEIEDVPGPVARAVERLGAACPADLVAAILEEARQSAGGRLHDDAAMVVLTHKSCTASSRVLK